MLSVYPSVHPVVPPICPSVHLAFLSCCPSHLSICSFHPSILPSPLSSPNFRPDFPQTFPLLKKKKEGSYWRKFYDNLLRKVLGAKMQKGTWAHRCDHGVKIDSRLIPHWCRNSRKKFDYRSRDFGSRDHWLSKERMGCRWGCGWGMGTGLGQWWVVVGVPMWYTDGGDDDVVGAVGTDRVYRDRVCQRSWQWYGVLLRNCFLSGVQFF